MKFKFWIVCIAAVILKGSDSTAVNDPIKDLLDLWNPESEGRQNFVIKILLYSLLWF